MSRQLHARQEHNIKAAYKHLHKMWYFGAKVKNSNCVNEKVEEKLGFRND
jgi:hypothetical protein